MDHVNGTYSGAHDGGAKCAAQPTPAHLPQVVRGKVKVTEVVTSRYDDSGGNRTAPGGAASASRPASWDIRRSGIDTVRTADGGLVRLRRTGAPSVPQPGWVLVITGGDAQEGFTWTLYGLPPRA